MIAQFNYSLSISINPRLLLFVDTNAMELPMGVNMNPMFINLIKGSKMQLDCTVSFGQFNNDELRGQFLSKYEVCGNSSLTDVPEFEGICKAPEHPEMVHQFVANLVLQCLCIFLFVSGLYPKRWLGGGNIFMFH